MSKYLKNLCVLPLSPAHYPLSLPIDGSPELSSKDQWQTSRQVSRAVNSFVRPEPAPQPAPMAISGNCASEIDWVDSPLSLQLAQNVSILAGNSLLPHSHPWASNYSGFQFGSFAGQLGDGRAMSLFLCQGKSATWEIQLKGCGRTPYSRFGDGFATLRASIREFLCSEFLASIQVPTTRALALLATGRVVEREGGPEAGAIVVRMSPSWLRFGSFEGPFYRSVRKYEETGEFDFEELNLVKRLAEHVVAQHYPSAKRNTVSETMLALLRAVSEVTAELIASWQAVGFVHGVLNTDNMSVLGQTLDFGPFGFMERYVPTWTSNSSDLFGRYCFENQPDVCFWNLTQFARTLLYWIASDEPQIASEKVLERINTGANLAKDVLAEFMPKYQQAYRHKMCTKLGLFALSESEEKVAFNTLVEPLLALFALCQPDYTTSFRLMCSIPEYRGDVQQHPLYFKLRSSLVYSFEERKRESERPKTLYDQRLADERMAAEAVSGKHKEFKALNSILQSPLEKQLQHLDAAWLKWCGDYKAFIEQRGSELTGIQSQMELVNPKYILRNWMCEEAFASINKKYFSSYTEDTSSDFSGEEGTWLPQFNNEIKAVWETYNTNPEAARFGYLYDDSISKLLQVVVGDTFGKTAAYEDKELQQLSKNWANGESATELCNMQCSCSS